MTRLAIAGLFAVLIGSFVQAAEKIGMVEVGKPAPPFKLDATQREKANPAITGNGPLSLEDLRGKNVVLFFFPKAMTKGCTAESCGFTKLQDKLAAVNTVAIGISVDVLADQQKFTEKDKLTTPLLADPDKKVTQSYGALNPNSGLARRYTFVIDKQGIVRKIYKSVDPAGHPKEVLAFITKELQ